MKRLFATVTLALILAFCPLVGQAQDGNSFSLERGQIQKLKILNADYDRIHFFIYCHNKQIFRIGDLTQVEAESILNHFKKNIALKVKATDNDAGFLDVTDWQ